MSLGRQTAPAFLAWCVAFSGAYAASVKLVLSLLVAQGRPVLIWPPSGFALAVLLLGGRRYWPGMLVGAALGQAWAGAGLGTSLGIALATTLGAFIGATALGPRTRFKPSLESTQDFLRLGTMGSLGVAVNALGGVGTLWLTGSLGRDELLRELVTWWRGDLLGVLLVTPIILVWRHPPAGWRAPARMLEAALCFAGTTAGAYALFLSPSTRGPVLPHGYWLLPFVLWSGLRLHRHGVLVVLGLIAVLGLAGSLGGPDLLSRDLDDPMSSLWIYLVTLSVSGLTLSLLAREPKVGRLILPWVVLATGQWVCLQTWRWASDDAVLELHTRFEGHAETVEHALRDRLHAYVGALRAARGLLAVAHPIDRARFRTFVGELRLTPQLPGLQGISFVPLVEPADLAQHTAAVRAEGFADYRVWPEGARPFHAPVQLLEPFDPMNRKALGYDLASEATRLEVLLAARDTRASRISGPLRLVQGPEAQLGVLLAAAVFQPGLPLDSPAERSQALRGWVTAPVVLSDLVRATILQELGLLSVAIYDGDAARPSALLHDTRPPGEAARGTLFRRTGTIDALGRTWTLVVTTRTAFEARLETLRSNVIAVAGTSLSLLLALVTWLLSRGRATAIMLAEQMTRELATRERELAAIIDTTPGCVKRVAPDGTVQAINPAGLALAEAEAPGQVIGRSVFDLIAPEDRDRYRRFHDDVCAGLTASLDYQIVGLNGHRRWVQTHAAPLRQGTDGPAIHLAVTLDITERQEAALALTRSEAYHRALMDSLPDLVVRIDTGYRIRYLNRPLPGRPMEQLTGQSLFDFLPPSGHARIRAILDEVRVERRLQGFEILFPGSPPAGRTYQGMAAPVITNGEVGEIVVSLRDVTEKAHADALLRRQADTLRRLATELSTARREVRRHVVKVLHDDVQQLLVASQFHLATLRSTASPQLASSLDTVVDLLKSGLAAVRTLTAQLRPLVLEQDELELTLRWLADWMHTHHGLNVEVRCAPELSSPVDTRELVFDAARELLFNVVKHARVTTASLEALLVDGHVELRVADEGCGFDSPAHAPRPPGGLGLVSLDERLFAVGGTLEIASQAGRGTTVVVRIPLTATPDTRHLAGSPSAPPRHAHALLLDEPAAAPAAADRGEGQGQG